MINAHQHYKKWELVKDYIIKNFEELHWNNKVVNGRYTAQVEEKLKIVSKRKFALLCRSGSHAISISLRAHGVVAGDHVIVPNYSCPATLSSVAVIGAVPILCEIDQYGMLSADHIEQCVNNKTRAVLATGLYGDVHNHDAVKSLCKKFNLAYINDAAQSQFAKYNGTESMELGDSVCVSFADNKPIPVVGTFGAMLTDNEEVYKKMRDMRKNGKPSRLESFTQPGYSSNPDEDKAVQILASWQYLDRWQLRKKQISEYYDTQFKNKIETRPRPSYSEWNYHKYVVFVDNKFESYKDFLKQGLETEQHYADNFAKLSWTPNYKFKFKMTDKFVNQALTIPNNPFMTDNEVEQVVKIIMGRN
tara:strand:+ start:3841 stop:4923 length:1083 start_codon:yes stop_codon:yes gene_type:complete